VANNKLLILVSLVRFSPPRGGPEVEGSKVQQITLFRLSILWRIIHISNRSKASSLSAEKCAARSIIIYHTRRKEQPQLGMRAG
jgi:hypothetical protein